MREPARRTRSGAGGPGGTGPTALAGPTERPGRTGEVGTSGPRSSRRRHGPPVPEEVQAELARVLAHEPPAVLSRATSSLEASVEAYGSGRYTEALRLAKAATELAPDVAAVRRAAGLAAYRSGRWRDAIRHLQAYRELSGDETLVPALMDSCRAAGRSSRVAKLWTELRQSSPDPDLLAEARIVAAATLADAGDLDGAVSLLADAGAGKSVRNPAPRHIRQWYVLADLYERAGDVPSARRLFARIERADPEAYDAGTRLAALGPERRRGRSSRPRSRRPEG